MKLDRLKSQLQTSGLQTKDFPLFQVIDTLITEVKTVEDTLAKFPSGFTDPLGVTHGGTGTALKFTKGSIVFAGDFGIYTQNNPNFFWDDTNKRLGIRTNTPANAFDLVDSVAGPLVLRIKNTYAAGASNVHASIIVENSSSYGQLFKAGVGYAGYKNIQANDLGFFNITGGNISTLNDSGNINFAANGASTPQLTITSTGVGISVTPILPLHIRKIGDSGSGTQPTWNANDEFLIEGTAAGFAIQQMLVSATGNCFLQFSRAGASPQRFVGGIGYLVTSGADLMTFYTANGTARAYLDTNGSFSIGATSISSTYKFQVSGGRGLIFANSEVYALGVGYSAGVGSLAFIGASNSATPDMILSNGAGTELARLIYAGGLSVTGDVSVSRGSAPTTGAVFFGGAIGSSHYLFFDGTRFNLVDPLLVNGALSNFSNGLDVQGAGANVADFQNNGGAIANIYISPSRTLNGGSFWDRWIFGAGQITTDDFGIGNSDRSFTAFQILGGATGGLVKFPYTKGISVTGPFGCNAATPQTPVASGGALAAYVTGAFGLDSNAHMQSLFNLVVSMRAALVANGIMS